MTLHDRIRRVEATNQLRIADWGRVMRNTHPDKALSMPENALEFRLERRGDQYLLRAWGADRETSTTYYEYNLPDWLRKIIEVARVAGAVNVINTPPPDELLWFATTKNKELIEFINLTDRPVP